MKRLSRLGKVLLEVGYAYPVAGLAAVLLAGMMFWGAFSWSLELANTEAFCISCHAMKEYVYTEYSKTTHHQNRTGVRASCPDCHVPREWIHKVVRKVGATKELFHWLIGSIDTPEKFEAKREELAREVSRHRRHVRQGANSQCAHVARAGGQVANDLYRMPPGDRPFPAAWLRQGSPDGQAA